ncbi:NUDIX domain-containing protein [Primorskyibacter aestuariivivens]|uniref:NUDIX domain-containing protein n=1 Tax=Primorskyibacter aestuariivivens TaxID=1888912 RepID=UPI0022FFFADF|nr:NUDIX domain-containing protein [Primorskyibacter aestuariivivens]MDA7429867.1 NUDIX domain-containing protein [Primorskyibacter aestuariivivens]
MADLFFFGTLCHGPLLACVLGGDVAEHRVRPAQLSGWAVHWVKDAPFPMILQVADGTATGVVLCDVTEEERARLSFYEGGFDYALREVSVETDAGPRAAELYVPAEGRWTPGADWDLGDWAARYGELTLHAAREVMDRYPDATPAEIDALFPWIRARAWSQMLAKRTAPTVLRRGDGAGDIVLSARSGGFDGFFRLRPFDIAYRRFDGQMSDRISREVFVSYDAALVLPYDPARDQVLLIEQLRFGPLWRGDPAPWVLEPIAGLVDAGEAPADCARREAEEEAGLSLGDLVPMMKVYASPGYTTEFFHCYLAICDLGERRGGLAGLDHESEDIRSHVLTFERVMELLDSGEINVGPLSAMLLWLARKRDHFRGETGAARP